MKSAGQHPVGGENVSELNWWGSKMRDAQLWCIIYVFYTGDYFSFPLTKCSVISQ